MNNKLSIIYCTSRKQPKFEWFVETLIGQYKDKIVTDQIVFIDTFVEYESDRLEKLKAIINDRFEYLHIPPKPSVWRGRHKKTKRDFFDASATRNTGLIVAETNHVVFIDDLCALMDGCIDFHRKAASEKIIFAGAYDKVSNIIVENNKVKSYDAKNIDGRAHHQIGDSNLKIGGGWIFGQNISFPFDCLKKINGYDEYFARRGCEDCNLGVRLELAGYKDLMFYNKNCLAIEDEWLHYNGDNQVDDFYSIRCWKSNSTKNNIVNQTFNEMMTKIEHDNLYVNKNYLPIDKNFNLIEEKKLYKEKNIFKSVENIVFVDFDGEPIENI